MVICGIVDSLRQGEHSFDARTMVRFSDGRKLALEAEPVEITLTKGKIYSFTVEEVSWWTRYGSEMHLVKTVAINQCGYDKEGS